MTGPSDVPAQTVHCDDPLTMARCALINLQNFKDAIDPRCLSPGVRENPVAAVILEVVRDHLLLRIVKMQLEMTIAALEAKTDG